MKTNIRFKVLIASSVMVCCVIMAFRINLTPNAISIEVVSPQEADIYQLFYDIGCGFNETDSRSATIQPFDKTVAVTFFIFEVPFSQIQGIQIDPGTHANAIQIASITLRHEFLRLNLHLPLYQWTGENLLKDFMPLHHIRDFTLAEQGLSLTATDKDLHFAFHGDWKVVQAALAGKIFRIRLLLIVLLAGSTSILLVFYHQITRSIKAKFFLLCSKNSSLKKYQMLFNGMLIIYVAIVNFPIRYDHFNPGLDPSWVFSMNYQFHKGIGKYLAWTGGPFEFLMCPMAIGFNLEIAIIFQLTLWILFFSTLLYFIYRQKTPFLRVLIFAVLLLIGLSVRRENFLIYLGIWLLFLSSYLKTWRPTYLGFLASIVVALLIKFSIVMALIGVGSVFIVSLYCRNERRKALQAVMLGLVIVPVCFGVVYLLYYPSLPGLFSFFQGSFQIASGYNVAMSIEGRSADLTIAAILFLVYALLLVFLVVSRDNDAFQIALCSFPALFIAFKHGFVMHDVHALLFFSSVAVIFSFILFFSKIRRTREYITLGIITMMILMCWNNALKFYRHMNLLDYHQSLMKASFQRFHELKHFSLLKQRLLNKDALESKILPATWLNSIGNSKVGIFPWELTYAAANDINYEPFPVFQSYSAYTSYLDTLNARYLEHSETAPAFILMEWMAIDGRHPLADVPAMWLSMYKWYDVYQVEEGRLLLKRRETPRFSDVKVIEEKRYRKDETIEIPESDHPVIVKLRMRLNVMGYIAKFLFKIPEVKMVVILTAGRLIMVLRI